MIAISMDKIREIESLLHLAVERHAENPDAYEGPPPLIGLCGLTGQLPALAEKLGIPWDEFETFVCLEDYCHRLADGMLPDDFPTTSQLASEMGIPEDQFSQWVDENVRAYHEVEDEFDDPFGLADEMDWDFDPIMDD